MLVNPAGLGTSPSLFEFVTTACSVVADPVGHHLSSSQISMIFWRYEQDFLKNFEKRKNVHKF
jgi:hypothetical protein